MKGMEISGTTPRRWVISCARSPLLPQASIAIDASPLPKLQPDASASQLNVGDALGAELSAQLTFQESLVDSGAPARDCAGDPAVEVALGTPPPEWACAYCGYAANAASVARCLATGRWFCNGRGGGAAACIVQHLVRSKHKEVALHKKSPLGDATLECYASGARNVFSLGYVPLRDENTVVLLARDTPPSAPAIKDLNVDVSQWQPLVEGRALVDWLVRRPPGAELARCRPPSAAQAAALEAAWRSDPRATLETLLEQAPEALETPDPLPVALRYPDG
jgi:regulator of nonsense transcripts 1